VGPFSLSVVDLARAFTFLLNLTLPVPLTTSREFLTTATARSSEYDLSNNSNRLRCHLPTTLYLATATATNRTPPWEYKRHLPNDNEPVGRTIRKNRETRHRANTIRTMNTPPCEYDTNYEHATVRIRYDLRTRPRVNTIRTTKRHLLNDYEPVESTIRKKR
jgi:hypothetical protein